MSLSDLGKPHGCGAFKNMFKSGKCKLDRPEVMENVSTLQATDVCIYVCLYVCMYVCM